MANHPSGAALTLVPPVLLSGFLSGVLNASQEATRDLNALLSLIAILGAMVVFLTALWSFILNLFFGKPERPYTGKIFLLFAFLVLAILAHVLARPPVFFWLMMSGALLSPLAGIAIGARWLAPFRWRDLKDPRLPAPWRKLLRGMALTAILPLGGLALPWWGKVRRRHGLKMARWAARLREPAVDRRVAALTNPPSPALP